jgi:hypothetical protein
MFAISSRTATVLFKSSQRQHESLCTETSLSGPAGALLKPHARLTIAIALRRMLSENFVSSRVAGREQGRANRRGQDKSRKVRPVGLMRNSAEFRLVANIANVSRTSPFSTTHYRTTTFDTLWRDR